MEKLKRLTFEDLKDYKFITGVLNGIGNVKLKVTQNISTNSKNEDKICYRLENSKIFFDVFDQYDVDQYELYNIGLRS